MPTRVACKHCNAKRVRCDRAILGNPCSNCRPLKIPCELIESKRGKYKRNHSSRLPKQPDSLDVVPAAPREPNGRPQSSDTISAGDVGQQSVDARRYVSPSLPDLIVDKGSRNTKVVYMGDSGNMKYLVAELGDPFLESTSRTLWGEHLHRSLTQHFGSATQVALEDARFEDNEHLKAIGALHSLDFDLSAELLNAFLEHSYPIFPIIDKKEFLDLHRKGQPSPLILNAIYCVAAIHCSDSLITRLGFASRYTACSTFYRRAKALHETNHESDGIINIQALILLMNWWESPMEQKDTWYWLSVATNLAQALGMHRAKSYTLLTRGRQKLWKRIWWILYTHDVHHAAVFGRPPHVHSLYIDLSPPSEQDLETFASESDLPQDLAHFHSHLFRIASTVHACLESKFSALRGANLEAQAYEEFLQYPIKNYACFSHPGASATLDTGYYPSLLRLIYSDYGIVLQRMLGTAPLTSDSSPFKIAGDINHVLEDLLAAPSDLVTRLPFISFPAIFCSILVYITSIRKETSRIAVLAEHRARLAMIVLDQLQDRWPVVVWTRYLLATMLDNKSASTSTHDHGSGRMWTRDRSDSGDLDIIQSRESTMDSIRGTQSRETTGSGSDTVPGAPQIEAQHMSNGRTWMDDINFSHLPLLFPGNDMLDEHTFGYGSWFSGQDFNHCI